MRIRWVSARSFGPFDDETLTLGEGLNVIVGPNESGKSTWHAAITAAVCGMRRGRGRRTKEDQAFTDRHRPWDRDAFEVSCLLELSDGRGIEMHHDLAGLIDCKAMDADLGTDISSEILNDQTPDGARLIGLDRESFRAVACVRQGEILAVIEDAGALHEHLQRAAATAGTDQTAAAALGIIDEVMRDEVGLDRANSTRPLRRAIEAVELARSTESEVRELHAEWQGDLVRLAEAEQELDRIRQTVAVAEAVQARERAVAARKRLDRMVDLGEELASSPDEPDPRLRRRVDDVRDRLVAWDSRTEPIEPEGDDAETLAQTLAALPEPIEGDTEVDSSVADAAEALTVARADLDAHRRLEPQPVEPVLPVEVDPDVAEALRSRLLASLPEVNTELRTELAELESAPTSPAVRRRPILFGVGGLAGLAGIALLVAGIIIFGVVLVAIGAAVALAGQLGSRAAHEAERSREARMAQLEAVLEAQRETRRHVEEERARAHSQAEQLGLPVEPDELKTLLASHRRVFGSLDEHRRWSEHDQKLSAAVDAAVVALASALTARGEPDPGIDSATALEAHAAYVRACAERAEINRAAAGRDQLQEQLTHRRDLEARVAEQRAQIDRLVTNLRAAADAIFDDENLGDETPVVVADRLRRWHDSTAATLDAADSHRQARAELESLLSGRSIDEHRDQTRSLERTMREAEVGIDPDEIAAFIRNGEPIDQLLAERRRAETDLAKLTAEHDMRSRGVPSVAEAVEATNRAGDELSRVETLAADLRETSTFLQRAQDQANRDLAPKIASLMSDRVGNITGGRYDAARVDPSDLTVTVRDPDRRWRPATALSHGTAEQIHLMLRIALADILTPDGRSLPMLLDDVLVQSDAERSLAVLEALRVLAEDRQIILFSQEGKVRSWADRVLGDDPRHRLIELEAPPSNRVRTGGERAS